LPDGETGTSVSIRLEPHLPCYIFSRGEYDDYEFKDIITLVQFIHKKGFIYSVKWLCSKLNIEYSGEQIKDYQDLDKLRLLKQRKRIKNKLSKLDDVQHEILSMDILNKYKPHIVEDWVKEGISNETQVRYNIRIDEKQMRYLIPIYNEDNQLISIKGRTYMPNHKDLDIPKYIYYYKLGINDILFGLNLHKQEILNNGKIILFEGEKSVMKAEEYGFYNTVSVGKDGINPYLLKKIRKLQCDVVIAFDKDVDYKSVLKEAQKISRYLNTYIMIDEKDLLDKKNAPVDKGKEVFLELYNNKKRL
jgi:DNA primase